MLVQNEIIVANNAFKNYGSEFSNPYSSLQYNKSRPEIKYTDPKIDFSVLQSKRIDRVNAFSNLRNKN